MSLPPSLLFRQLFDRTSCTYTYLLAHLTIRTAVLIDPVDTHIDRDLKLISELGLHLTHVLNTHVHADHVSASGHIKRKLPHVKSVISKASAASADILVSSDDCIPIGPTFALRVIQTPGHTKGCVSYYLPPLNDNFSGMVFTGDALFIRGCGRTDFQGGSPHDMYHSVHQKLFSLPPDTIVYPGHDYKGMNCSTIAEELAFNPRLRKGISEQQFVTIMNELHLAYPKLMDVAVPANLNCGIGPEYPDSTAPSPT